MKKLLLIFLAVAVTVTAVYLFFQYRRASSPETKALNAVPADATVIFSSRDIRGLWSQVKETNIIWQELLGSSFFSRLNEDVSLLDSMLHLDQVLNNVLHEQPLLMSSHPDAAGDYHFLFLLNLPNAVSEGAMVEFIKRSTGSSASNVREVEGVTIRTTQAGNAPLHYFQHKNLFALTFSAELAEKSVKQLFSENSLATDSAFTAIRKTSGLFVDANVFINFSRFSHLLEKFLSAKGQQILTLDSASEGWSALDLAVKPDAVLLNGFSAPGGNDGFLASFNNQTPQTIGVPAILPASVSAFAWLGFSHTNSWLSERKANSKLFEWVEREAVAAATPGTEGVAMHYNIFSSRNPAAVMEGKWLKSDMIKDRSDTASFTYRGFLIRKIPIDSTAFSTTFGHWFNYVHKPLSFSVGPYIVMADDSTSAFFFIDEYLREQVLSRDESYQLFSSNLAGEANLYFYAAVNRSMNEITSLTEDSLQSVLVKERGLYEKFGSAGLQLSRSENLFYTSAFLRYSPVQRESKRTLWEARLDHPVISRPWIFINHNDKTREVLVQDSAFVLYLLDNKGQTLWKVPLGEAVMGDIHQVDAYRNNKFQILFNTRSKLHLIDRNGNNVGGFPLELPTPATAPLTLFDYDKNLDYRILIAGEDRKVRNFDIRGTALDGWKPIVMDGPLNSNLVHTSIQGKDYILAADASGKVYGVDRRGEPRLTLRVPLPENHGQVCLDKGRDLASTFLVTTDTAGNIHRLSLADVPEVIKAGRFTGAFRFNCINSAQGGGIEYFFTDTTGIFRAGPAGNQTAHFNVTTSRFTEPQVFLTAGNMLRYGFTDVSAGQTYIFDQDGKMIDGFPKRGFSAFAMGDLNRDGELELIVAGAGNTVLVYNIKD